MADDETTETVEEDARSETDDLDKMRAALKKANAEAAKYRKDAKANSDAAKRLQEAEDAEKSEVDRLKEQLQNAEKRATDAESKSLRAEIASGKGLTPAQAKRLVGSSKEELESDADELLETFGATKKKDDGPDDGSKGESGSSDEDGSKDDTSTRRPREQLRDGAAPNEETQNGSPDDLADAVLKKSRGY